MMGPRPIRHVPPRSRQQGQCDSLLAACTVITGLAPLVLRCTRSAPSCLEPSGFVGLLLVSFDFINFYRCHENLIVLQRRQSVGGGEAKRWPPVPSDNRPGRETRLM